MCGIAGYVGVRDEGGLLERMAGTIRHRGPDDEGLYRSGRTGLANRRLSIIDLEGGHQPITNETGDVWVVFNGEIYNFPQLRQDLEARGHRFRTVSDTEVIVHLYEEHGESFADRLRGMFAIALWVEHTETLLLVRDHLGKKPLFYWQVGDRLVFGSEVKAILEYHGYQPDVDPEALHFYLNFRWVPGESTLFAGIKNVLPSHVVRFQRGDLRTWAYWEMTTRVDDAADEEEVAGHVRDLLRQAVHRRQLADVPVGVFLSGGVDSTAIVALMRDLGVPTIRTFTLGFGDPTDETRDARRVAEYYGTEHHDLVVDANPLRFLPQSVWHAETGKVNCIQVYLVSKLAREQVKVALSGIGGDELFGGYDNYMYLKPAQLLGGFVPRWIQRQMTRASGAVFSLQSSAGGLRGDQHRRGLQLLLALGDRTRTYMILRNAWDEDPGFYEKIYAPDFAATQRRFRVRDHFAPYFRNRGGSILAQAMTCELREKLVADQMWMEDRMTMANGLESRAPFLDRDLVEYCQQVPDRMKIRGLKRKYILRRALQGLVPDFVFEKPKWGFAFVPHRQFSRDLRSTVRKVLTRERVERDGLFNYDYIAEILGSPPNRSMGWHYFYLWNLTAYHMWHDMFISRSRTVEDITEEIAQPDDGD